eukprot:TRINITY_DN27268_c0_g1_i1.p1 TRINITY_DN27268_c0_g1~~TRINITY_DN27268_c0_g1_i1.p1  ORF type:complete len:500 (+),score=73.66 TRINITY_DN27268_c0_g1_i1:44-1543(+)
MATRSVGDVTLTSFAVLCLLIVLGQYMRMKIKLLQRLFLPTAVIAGTLGMVIYQILVNSGEKAETFAKDVTAGWSYLPSILINIVFASLFLGVHLPGPKQIWNEAGQQLSYGMLVVWGQWFVGCLATVAILMPVWNVNKLMATTLPIGFAGGHGTAGGMGDQYEKYDWAVGKDYGLFAATVGILSAVLFGIVSINWAVRTGRMEDRNKNGTRMSLAPPIVPVSERMVAGRITVPLDSIDTLTLHLAFIGIAVLFGVTFKYFLVEVVENNVQAIKDINLFNGVSTFPFCMVGGLLMQKLFQRMSPDNCPIDRDLTERLSALALEFLITAAMAVLDLESLADDIVAFIVLMICGFAWQAFCLLVLAPRILTDHWFERGVTELGSAMGIVATGLLMIRMCDPQSQTPVLKAFVYKNAVQALFMGGGLWTALGFLLTEKAGPLVVLFITGGVTLMWLLLCIYLKVTDGKSGESGENMGKADPSAAEESSPLQTYTNLDDTSAV